MATFSLTLSIVRNMKFLDQSVKDFKSFDFSRIFFCPSYSLKTYIQEIIHFYFYIIVYK